MQCRQQGALCSAWGEATSQTDGIVPLYLSEEKGALCTDRRYVVAVCQRMLGKGLNSVFLGAV